MTHIPKVRSKVALNQENSCVFNKSHHFTAVEDLAPKFNLNVCLSEFASGFCHESSSSLRYV